MNKKALLISEFIVFKAYSHESNREKATSSLAQDQYRMHKICLLLFPREMFGISYLCAFILFLRKPLRSLDLVRLSPFSAAFVISSIYSTTSAVYPS